MIYILLLAVTSPVPLTFVRWWYCPLSWWRRPWLHAISHRSLTCVCFVVTCQLFNRAVSLNFFDILSSVSCVFSGWTHRPIYSLVRGCISSEMHVACEMTLCMIVVLLLKQITAYSHSLPQNWPNVSKILKAQMD